MKFTCRFCRVTFVGPGAVTRWSDHTWVHWPELLKILDAPGSQ